MFPLEMVATANKYAFRIVVKILKWTI